jgi:hypothetical protein
MAEEQQAIANVDLMHRVRKSQFTLGKLGIIDKTAPENWNAVLAARSVVGSRALGALICGAGATALFAVLKNSFLLSGFKREFNDNITRI